MALSPGQMPDNQDPKPPPIPKEPATPNFPGSSTPYPNNMTEAEWQASFVKSAVGGGDPYAPGGPSTVPPPKLPSFKIPPVPGAAKPKVVTDPYAQYKQNVNKNLQYLTAKERSVVQQRQAKLDQVHTQTQKTFDTLQKLAKMSQANNPAANKMLQTYLNSKGYKLGVDGAYGPQTYNALKDYLSREQTNANRKLSQTAQFAHPMTVRAEANAAIPGIQVQRQRAAVIGYTINKIADLYGAQQQAAQDVKDGKAGAKERLDQIQQAIKGYQRLQGQAKDPIKGMDAVSLDQTFHAIETRQIMELQEANRAAAGQNDLTASLADAVASDPLLKFVTNQMDNVFNKGSAAFAAAFETGLHTGNYFKALQAFVGSIDSVVRVPGTDVSLVGLTAPGGSDARKWIEATNTPAERDALVAKGDLLSIGQTLTGHVTPAFEKAHPAGLGNALTLVPGLVDMEKGRLGYGDGSGTEDWAQAGTKVVKGFDPVSAAADLLVLPAKDPTFALSALTEPLANIGTWAGDQALKHASPEMIDRFGEPVIRQMGIISQLTNTVTGRAMQDGIGRVLSNTALTGTEQDLMKALPGLSSETAAAAIAAREAAPEFADGVQAAKNIITSAIVDETYNPQISFVRQLSNNLAGSLGLITEDAAPNALGIEASLGRKAIRGTVREQWIRQFAQVKGGVASTFESDANAFMNETLDTVSRLSGNNIDGLWSDSVSQAVHGMSMEDRYYRAVQTLYHTFADHPQIAHLQAAFEGIMRPFFTNPDILDVVPHSTYMDFAFAQEGVRDASGRISQTFEDAMRKAEVLGAYADESLATSIGQHGMEVFDDNLARGFILTPAMVKNATVTAAQNVGLQLPGAVRKGVKLSHVEGQIRKLGGELESHFDARLAKLGGGRKGLGRLARDVEAVTEHKDLREELQRVLDQQAGRTIESAPRRTGGVVQKAARVALSTMDVIPPTEIRFKYPTANAIEHSRLRAQSVTRYLQAFYVPKDVENTLVRASEKIQTEEEMFAFRERLTRTVLDARGVQNPDAVMSVLKARGEFTGAVAKRPIRTIIDGQPIEDIQVLSQRIESARIYSPHEIAAATRQAIINGATDANLARRMAASIRAVPDHLGEISLHFDFGGKTVTLAKGVKGLHKLWKFLIVTNAGMPLVGAAGGFLFTNGSIGDRLHNAGLGFLIGSVGPARYLFRVVGVEDRFRMLMSNGFNNDIHLPGMAKLRSLVYDADPYARSLGDDVIRVGNYGSRTNFENEALAHTDSDWAVISRNHSRAADAWWRIGNHQVHPESDPVMAILLREKAGHLGGEETIQHVVPVETQVLEKAAAAEPPADAAGLWADAFGAPADKQELSPLQQAADEALAAQGVNPAQLGKSNDELLSDFGQAHGAGDGHPETKTFFRGEPAAHADQQRGINWTSDEELARNRAGADGITYKVELPVDEHGVPLVGRDAVAAHGEVGWLLDGPDRVWADAADHALPNGFAATAADAAKFRVENIVVQRSDREVADAAIKQFLDSEEGALWKARWKGAIGGTSSPRKAIARMRDFVDRYMTPELAAMRVAGGVNGTAMEIPRDVFERALKEGIGPEEFHAQQVWKLPHSLGDVFKRGEMTAQKTVLAGPSNFLNRGPWKSTLQKQEYDRMIRAGVDPERAQRIADQFANRTVNSIMHRFDEPSRLAAAVDIFAPFQHAKEDIVRVYSRLLVNHPGKAVRVVYYVAKLFNNGKNAGIFTHNDFTHQWEVSIPGTARLANALFGTPFAVDFQANIASFLYLNASGFGGKYGGGFLPQPGGPFWSLFSKALAEAHPDLFTGSYPLHDWLWGYGPNGNLLSSNTSRMWMAFSGETPPWEAGNQDQWQSQLNRWRTEVTQQLVYQHLQKDPSDTGWLPAPQDVDKATSAFFKAWSFFGSVVPVTSYPSLTGKNKYEQAVDAFTVGGLIPLDKQAFLAEYPEFEPYVIGATTEYVGPDDLATLRKLGVGNGIGQTTFNPETGQWDTIPGQKVENYTVEDKLGYRRYISDQQFRDEFKQYQRTSDYYKALTAARAIANPLDRESALIAVNKKYADIIAGSKRSYDIELELHTIQWKYPKGLQAQAQQRVKNQYGLSNQELQYFISKGTDKLFQPSPWRDARLGSEVASDVAAHLGSHINDPGAVARYVSTLNPAEQARFWEYEVNAQGYDNGIDDPFAVLRKHDYFRKQYYGVRDNYPWLYRAKDDWVNPFTKSIQATEADLGKQTTATYAAIDKIQAEMSAAADTKNWSAYYKLKAQRDNLYTLAGEIHNKLLDKIPDLTKYYEDMHAAGVYGAAGNETEQQLMIRQAKIDAADAPFFLIPEEKRFLAMPDPVKRAYGQSLVEALNMPPGKYPHELNTYIKDNTGLHKLFWEYLTPFQQHVLEASYPKAYVDRWKADSEYYLHGEGAIKTGRKIPDDLAYAYSLLSKYSQRGDMKEPAAYQQYLQLPPNHAVRAQFLASHPDVKAYLNASPFKHMPPHLRDVVSGILAKYGKGFSSSGNSFKRGFGRGKSGNPDLEWAKFQLFKYGALRKGQKAPATYDLWVNMPTGQAKAEYLKQHPEIGNWLKLGPMANMPEIYKQVVRDIMVKYGGWSQRQDPLGATITQFFATPGYAREQFLQQHPELQAYWAVTRTPQEQVMSDLENTYFSIQDVGAKKAFLASHPELQTQFLNARTNRYEQFLNQVAIYMGANPSMFEQYLTRQNDIMAELLRKFAEPMLLREQAPQVETDVTGGEGGRNRQRVRPAA